MAYVDILGQPIYYEVHGQGEKVFLLHHGFGALKMWHEIAPALVDSGYQIIMYDRRGYGMSEEGPDFVDFYRSQDFRDICVQELEILRQYLQIETFHLIGQCEGGVVAADYTVKHPDHVKSLITSSTQCYSTIPMKELNAQKFPKPFPELDPNLKKKFIKFHGADRAEFRYDLYRSFGGCYGCGYFDLRPVLQSIYHPSLVIYPDRSYIFDVAQGLAFYKHLQNGQLSVLPKCGHNTYEHQPQEYLKQLCVFWNQVSA